MTKESRTRYTLMTAILVLNIGFAYVLNAIPGMIIFGLIVCIPAAIYIIKYGMDRELLGSLCLVVIVIGLFLGKDIVVINGLLVILPQIMLGYLIHLKLSFKDTVAIFSLVLLGCIIGIIAILNIWYGIDIIAYYYQVIEAVEADFIKVYGNFIVDNTKTLEEYALLMDSLKGTFSFMKYYYPAMLYMMCMGLSFMMVLIIRLIANRMVFDEFKLKNILNIKISRNIIFFLIGVLIIKAFITDSSSFLLVATNNLMIILLFMLFLLGMLFEIFMIMRAESKQHKFFLIMMSIFCLIFFKTYFVIAGFIEGTFQIRRRLSKANPNV